MQDNDFWIGQEQIPVDLSLLLTYHNDEDYWYAPGEYALRVYTVDTLNTNFARPCFALGERKFDPEMEDVSGAIENTLHELLDSGATPEDVYRIMGLVKESELSPETKEADSYLPIDLGYCIDGNIVSYEAVPESVATVPENIDYPRYAEAMESHVPLPIATQIAKHDFSHRQADILMEAAYLVVAHGGSDLPVERLSRSQLLTINNILLQGHIPYETVRAIAKPAFTPESMEVIAAAMENARHDPYTGEHSLTEAQVARIMNPEYRPEQQIALLAAMRGQTPVADLSDADFAGLFPASLSVEQMSACAYAVNRCGYNAPLLMMTMQACADMNVQQLMAVFDATAAEFSDATMAKVSTILMHTPALTSQQMRYLLAEARDGTPFPALESMKEHLLAQAEPEKAQVIETGVKSESRDMASGKEALAEQTELDSTQKINQNKEME